MTNFNHHIWWVLLFSSLCVDVKDAMLEMNIEHLHMCNNKIFLNNSMLMPCHCCTTAHDSTTIEQRMILGTSLCSILQVWSCAGFVQTEQPWLLSDVRPSSVETGIPILPILNVLYIYTYVSICIYPTRTWRYFQTNERSTVHGLYF